MNIDEKVAKRKTLYESFKHSHKQIAAMTKNKNVSKQDIANMASETGEKMKRILSISSAEGSSLKN